MYQAHFGLAAWFGKLASWLALFVTYPAFQASARPEKRGSLVYVVTR
jgi:hypothetical protein